MRYLAFLLMGLVPLPAFSLTTVNLYQAEVAIDQQQDNADAKARSLGMQQVIVRATGDKNAVDNGVVKKALNKYNQYLNQFSYGQSDDTSTLTMEFSAPQIRSLLTQAQLPYWPESRANVLVWLVEESTYERSVSWEHSDSKLLQQLKQTSVERGLPITVPVGDFDDITGLEISDLWGGFIKPISFASQRYPTDAIVVVRAQGDQLRWTLYDQSAQAVLQSQKVPMTGRASGAFAAAQMVDDISDYYANKSAVLVSAESSNTVLAAFDSLNGAEDFFTLEGKLKRLSSVASLDILKIQGNKVTFNVHLLATESDFEQEVLRMGQVQKAKVVAPLVVTEPLIAVEPLVGVDPSVTPASERHLEPEIVSTEGNASLEDTQKPTMSDNTDIVVPQPVVPEVDTLRFNWLG